MGQALRGNLMKGEGGKDVGDEPDRKIASKLGHLLISKKILEKHTIKIV